MNDVGQRERIVQERVISLLREQLGYRYLDNWIDREGNRNIEEDLLRTWLESRGHTEAQIGRVLHQLNQAAALGQGRDLYDASKAVYSLLRYGVKVQTGVGDHYETVWLIDWDDAEANDFAVAEEVSIQGENRSLIVGHRG